jgi:hypothetical protein
MLGSVQGLKLLSIEVKMKHPFSIMGVDLEEDLRIFQSFYPRFNPRFNRFKPERFSASLSCIVSPAMQVPTVSSDDAFQRFDYSFPPKILPQC